MKRPWLYHGWRLLALALLCLLALQIVFAARIALMAVLSPSSTSFQRSEAWRLLSERRLAWSQQWVDADNISNSLKRAVIVSEDAGFASHRGIDWAAVEKAWQRNQRSDTNRVVGGSTITQQLAKNLLLSGERTVLRKAQEAVLVVWLEVFLSKERILELYLNHVEWGEGVFGAQAAAQRYFQVDAAKLGAMQAARLAVMLPAPKRFERRPATPYVLDRAATIAARMGAAELP